MTTPAYFQRLADYNQWMNQKLYGVCATLSEAEQKQERGAFFGSIHGTLNHILLADQLWLARFHHKSFAITSLAQELHADFAGLFQARQATDADIQTLVAELTPEQLQQDFTFHSLSQQRTCRFPLWHVLLHFFNHQTHHRGQLTTLLNQGGWQSGVTDLLWLPETELGLAVDQPIATPAATES